MSVYKYKKGVIHGREGAESRKKQAKTTKNKENARIFVVVAVNTNTCFGEKPVTLKVHTKIGTQFVLTPLVSLIWPSHW